MSGLLYLLRPFCLDFTENPSAPAKKLSKGMLYFSGRERSEQPKNLYTQNNYFKFLTKGKFHLIVFSCSFQKKTTAPRFKTITMKYPPHSSIQLSYFFKYRFYH